MKIHMNLITNKKRKAIAMVELIFAIVVIGITLLSIPLMVNEATESTYSTLQQEGIAAAAADMSLILSREWDEANTNDLVDSTILTTTSGNLDEGDRTNLQSRTYLTSVGGRLAASSIGAESDLDDIDDVHGSTVSVTGGTDLVDQSMSITTTVSYLSDGSISTYTPTAGSATSNIKGITILLTTSSTANELDKNITLNAFSSNIGSYKLERRILE